MGMGSRTPSAGSTPRSSHTARGCSRSRTSTSSTSRRAATRRASRPSSCTAVRAAARTRRSAASSTRLSTASSLFDQRGCGKSTPHASLEANTTWDLVSDIEKLRAHLGIERWQVFGGSWGSTLALAYAEKHPERVTELVLRGIFLLRKKEIDWFYQEGARSSSRTRGRATSRPSPKPSAATCSRRTTAAHERGPRRAARGGEGLERLGGRTCKLLPDAVLHGPLRGGRVRARLRAHRGPLLREQGLLRGRRPAAARRVEKIRHIPGVIVQGRYDVVCPIDSAWALHRAWPEADLIILPDAGHSAWEPPNGRALVAATDKFA